MAAPRPQPKRILAWLDPGQADLVRAVAEHAHIEIVGAGSPAKAQAGAAATALGCPSLADLRSALTEGEADAVFIAAPGDFGRADAASDAPALLAARARGVKVATLEPFPTSAIDLATRGWTDTSAGVAPASVARLVPLPRHTRPFRDATELIPDLGTIRCVGIESLGGHNEGSLAARLAGAIDTVLLLMGEPELVDAACVSPLQGQGVHALPGETLTDLHGDVSASLRFADGRAASILASSHASRWNFTCTILSERGRLRVYDDGFELLSPTGVKLDEARHRRTRGHASTAPGRALPGLANAEPLGAPHPSPHAVAAMADALSRLLDQHIPDTGPPDWTGILCLAQATLLSARTGQPESPTTFRTMVGRL